MRTSDSSKRLAAISYTKELPDLPGRPASSSIRQRIRQICIHLWIWELLSLLLCLSCVGTIMIILVRYDGEPIPTWSYGLTINGVISVLAGVAKASMILPVAESISQLKWHWYWNGQSRPVMDFEYFDTASRGPWGCVLLLCRPRQWSVASIGALITVVALVMEPSLQFIPAFPARLTDGGHAVVHRSTYYNDVINGIMPDTDFYGEMVTSYALGTSTKNALYKIVYGMRNDTSVTTVPTCSTGNCTWPSFSSVAVCSSCTDLSDMVYQNTNPSASDWWLPTHAWMDDSSLFSTTSYFDTLAYNKTADQAFIDASYMYHDFLANGTKNKPNALECILYFCVREYSVKVTAGIYSEEVLSEWPGPHEPVPDAPDLSANPGSASKSPNVTHLKLRPPGQHNDYLVNTNAFRLLKNWLGELIGSTAWSGGQDSADGDQSSAADVAQAMYQIQIRDDNDGKSGPERVFSTIAEGLSAAIRQQGNSSMAVKGTALREQSYVRARWGWAIPPLALVMLTCCFLITTLAITARNGIPVWKSSALATLAHGLGETSSGTITADQLDVVERKAHGYKMAMRDRKRQWRLESVAV